MQKIATRIIINLQKSWGQFAQQQQQQQKKITININPEIVQ